MIGSGWGSRFGAATLLERRPVAVGQMQAVEAMVLDNGLRQGRSRAAD